jgi:hypothetical protein
MSITTEFRKLRDEVQRRSVDTYNAALGRLRGPESLDEADRRALLKQAIDLGPKVGKSIDQVERDVVAAADRPKVRERVHIVVALPDHFPGTCLRSIGVDQASTGGPELNPGLPDVEPVIHPGQTPEDFNLAVRCWRAKYGREPDGLAVRVAELVAVGFEPLRPGIKVTDPEGSARPEAIARRTGLFRILQAVGQARVLQRAGSIGASKAALYECVADRLGILTSAARERRELADAQAFRATGGANVVFNPPMRVPV